MKILMNVKTIDVTKANALTHLDHTFVNVYLDGKVKTVMWLPRNANQIHVLMVALVLIN